MVLRAKHSIRRTLRAVRQIAVLAIGTMLVAVAGCRDATTQAPGVGIPKLLKVELVEGQSVPYRMYFFPRGGSELIDSAILKPEVGPNAQATTNGKVRMADVRVFRGLLQSGAFAETHRDSSTVLLERKGDLLLITRSYQFPGKVRVDTGRFASGKMVVVVNEWEWLEFPPDLTRAIQFVYKY